MLSVLGKRFGGAPEKDLGLADLPQARASGRGIIGKSHVTSFDDLRACWNGRVLTCVGGALYSEKYSNEMAVFEGNGEGQYLWLCSPELFKTKLQLRTEFDVFAATRGFSLATAVPADPAVILQLNAHNITESEAASSIKTVDTKAWRWMDNLLQACVSVNASDIHLEPRRPGGMLAHDTRVRARIDGELLELSKFSASYDFLLDVIADVIQFRSSGQSQSVYSKLASMSATLDQRMVKTMETGRSDGAKERPIQGRIQTTPIAGDGQDFVMRILYGDLDYIPTMQDLGYLPSQIAEFMSAIGSHKGLTCMAGRVGSGKSTTLRTIYNILSKSSKKYSVEDPREYFHPNCSQIEIQRDPANPDAAIAKMKEVLGALKRLDLDAVLLGEIRDLVTAAFVRDVTFSGHAVFSTLHSGSALGQIPRMATPEMGLSYEDLGNSDFLRLLAYQTLVPKLCPHCSFSGARAKQELGAPVLNVIGNRFKVDIEGFRARNPEGCEKCIVPNVPERNGYKGRIVVAETYSPTLDDLDLISHRKMLELSRAWASRRTRKGFADPDATGKTVQEVGLYHVTQGVLDARSVAAKCEQWESYRMFALESGSNH